MHGCPIAAFGVLCVVEQPTKLTFFSNFVVDAATMSDGPELLPADVKPSHYEVKLTPNFENFTFDGQVVRTWHIYFLPTFCLIAGSCLGISLTLFLIVV